MIDLLRSDLTLLERVQTGTMAGMGRSAHQDDHLREQAQAVTRREAERLRRQLGLTYRDLAAKSDVGVTTVHRLLRGPGWVRPGQLAAVSDALGIGRSGLAAIENEAFEAQLELVRAEEASTITPEGIRIAVELEPGAMEDFTPGEIQEVLLGAKKGAIAVINEISTRRRQFRRVVAA